MAGAGGTSTFWTFSQILDGFLVTLISDVFCILDFIQIDNDVTMTSSLL